MLVLSSGKSKRSPRADTVVGFKAELIEVELLKVNNSLGLSGAPSYIRHDLKSWSMSEVLNVVVISNFVDSAIILCSSGSNREVTLAIAMKIVLESGRGWNCR
jgi:hypothetical protein